MSQVRDAASSSDEGSTDGEQPRNPCKISVYVNPHFRDAKEVKVLERLERMCGGADFRAHMIEGLDDDVPLQDGFDGWALVKVEFGKEVDHGDNEQENKVRASKPSILKRTHLTSHIPFQRILSKIESALAALMRVDARCLHVRFGSIIVTLPLECLEGLLKVLADGYKLPGTDNKSTGTVELLHVVLNVSFTDAQRDRFQSAVKQAKKELPEAEWVGLSKTALLAKAEIIKHDEGAQNSGRGGEEDDGDKKPAAVPTPEVPGGDSSRYARGRSEREEEELGAREASARPPPRAPLVRRRPLWPLPSSSC